MFFNFFIYKTIQKMRQKNSNSFKINIYYSNYKVTLRKLIEITSMNFYIKNLIVFWLLIDVSMETMPFLFDFANPYALDLPIQQVYLQPPNFVLIRFVGTQWVKLDKSLTQISSFTFNNQDIATARLIGTSKLNGLNQDKNKIFILNIASAQILYTVTAFSNIVFSQQVYITVKNLKRIVVTLPTEIYAYNLINNSTLLKYTLISDQFVVQVYFNDTMSFIGTSSGKIYKKVISTNSTDFNITLELLYQHSSQVQNLFIDNGRNLVSQDINLVLMGYDVILSANVTFDISFSSKRLSQIAYIYYGSYFIFYTELLQVFYNQTIQIYTTITVLQSSITVAPLHAVTLDVETNQIPFGYVKNSNLIYKFNPCINNNNYRSSQDKCISFSCSESACTTCSLSANLCSSCTGGYYVQNGTCLKVQTISKYDINNEIKSLSESAQVLINSASQMNSISSFRFFLTFLMPLFEFFDDYWYYIYHQINYQNLPTLKTFFCIMYYVNNQRLLPGFINAQFANNIVQNLNSYVGDNYQKHTNVNVFNIDQNQRYFLINCQNLFIFQYFIVIMTFLFIKLVLHFLKLSDKNRIQPETDQKLKSQKQQTPPELSKVKKLKISLQKYLKSKTLSKMLLSAFIQSNLIFLMFTASSQLSIFFSFKSIDKINQALSLIFLFSCVIFGFCFYLLTQNNFSHKKNNKYSSVIFETLTLGTKNILNGFIHGMFLQNNTLQIILLMLVKIFLICILLRIGKEYKSKFKLTITIFYYFFGLVLDLILLINELFQTSSSTFSHINLVCLISIVSIVIVVFLSIIVQTAFQLIQFFCHQKNNQNSLRTKTNLNTIQPIVQTNYTAEQIKKKQFFKLKIKRPLFYNSFIPKHNHPFFSNQTMRKMPKQIKTTKDSHFDFKKDQLKILQVQKQPSNEHPQSKTQTQKRKSLKIKTTKKTNILELPNNYKGFSIQTRQMKQNEKKTWKESFNLKNRQEQNTENQNKNK